MPSPSAQAQPQPELSTTTPQILPVPNPVPSYWLREPSQHANLRSTPALPKECDIAIIGSGMAGVLTLYHILQSSAAATPPQVVLLDARQLCSGATGRNGGHAKIKTDTLASLPQGTRGPMQRYVSSVIHALKALVEAENLADECEFELRRSFDVFQDAGAAAAVQAAYDAAVANGEPWTHDYAPLGRAMASGVTSIRGAAAAWSCPCASFWPYKLVAGLLERLVARYPGQLNVQMNTAVTLVQSGSCGTRLHTPRGTVQAGKVVFATNAWTAGVLPQFRGTITPVKGMASHHIPARPVWPHLNSTYNIHFSPSVPASVPRQGTDYLNPRPDGGIVVGGGAYMFRHDRCAWDGNFDDSVRFGGEVERHWEGYMPDTFLGWERSGSKTESVWVGIMGYTGDGMMHVGRIPGNGGGGEEGKRQQWMLAGFNGGGMAMIAVAAKAVAKMVLEDFEFEDVREEFGLLDAFGTNVRRLKGSGNE